MLFLHESHMVQGAAEDDFEAAYRDGWLPALDGDDARLLWYFDQAHGSGASYRVVTITALAGAGAWQRLIERMTTGDLRSWAAEIDRLRYDVQGKMLLPVDWSPLQRADLATIPPAPADHEPTLYMEDTGWPDAPIGDYLRFWGDVYHPMLLRAPADRRLLEIKACFTPAWGTHVRREGILLQRIHDLSRLHDLLTTETPPAARAAGTYMAEGLKLRDQWESRLLRTAAWSPLD